MSTPVASAEQQVKTKRKNLHPVDATVTPELITARLNKLDVSKMILVRKNINEFFERNILDFNWDNYHFEKNGGKYIISGYAVLSVLYDQQAQNFAVEFFNPTAWPGEVTEHTTASSLDANWTLLVKFNNAIYKYRNTKRAKVSL